MWHTQGSGKSMEMELYTNLVSRHPKLKNPTIVVVTDRNELDGQLFSTFDRSLLLAEKPTQVRERAQLRDELRNRVTGGIYFTTLQKFGLTDAEKAAGIQHPLLTDRRNVILIVDEAHRSHYDDLDGYARHLRDALPNATLIAFTGTPISFAERNTQDVFGDYIDIYDLTRAVDDGATVPVYFEPRLIKVGFAEGASEEDIDRAADEYTLGLDDTERAQLEASVAVVNAVYGAPERIETLAKDIVAHWEERQARMLPFIESPGKALIVGGTREICARLYNAIVALRPDWHSDALDGGKIKVVYSGSATDQPPVSDHVRRDSGNAAIKERLKDPGDELELVIVKDMMLTGFDAPPLHTLYLDRPLKGALLMQTLARVNRTFRGKQDGLLVAYAPLAENLAKALAEYTDDRSGDAPGRTRRRRGGSRDRRRTHRSDPRDARGLRLEVGSCPGRSARLAHRRDDRPRTTCVTRRTRSTLRTLGRRRSATLPRGERAAGPRVGPVLRGERASPICTRRSPSTKRSVCGWRSSTRQERQARDEPIPEEIQRLLAAAGRGGDRSGRRSRHLRRGGAAAPVAG